MFKKISKIFLSFVLVVCFISPIFAGRLADKYNGEPYIEINNNVPDFTEKQKTSTKAYEYYSELDELGRCGVCEAVVSIDTMPTGKRESISSVTPSGWKFNGESNNLEYDFVSGGYIYNRSHLIGWQLTGQNANKKNLITGTKYFNVTGMLPFENDIASFIKKKKYHVFLRVTPYFEGDNLVCDGIYYEAYSIEDGGKGISINVFIFNVEPGVYINYENGRNYALDDLQDDTDINADIEDEKKESFLTKKKKNIIENYKTTKEGAGGLIILIIVLIFIFSGDKNKGNNSASGSVNTSMEKKRRSRSREDVNLFD